MRSVITSSQRGGELRESEAPGEKRIMGREWGAALGPHAERRLTQTERDAHIDTYRYTHKDA